MKNFALTVWGFVKEWYIYISAAFYFAILIFAIFVYYAMLPPNDFSYKKDFLLEIPAGSSILQTAETLKQKKLIKNKAVFTAWLRLRYGSVKAGDYLIKRPESGWVLSKRLAKGISGLSPVKVRIKEGASRTDMIKEFQGKFYKFNPDEFLLLTEDKEGFLFPDTYTFYPNLSTKDIVNTLLGQFHKKIKPFENDIAKSPLSLKELVTLASLVEREASDYDDRRKIAGVLLNRLKLGMPLQVDVTWFYTHNKGTFGITMRDLKDKKNPYNTYIHKGLPPTPIGSPSLDAIKACIYPTKSDYLFYLADKNGVTHFSKTYKEHLRKRNLYFK